MFCVLLRVALVVVCMLYPNLRQSNMVNVFQSEMNITFGLFVLMHLGYGI